MVNKLRKSKNPYIVLKDANHDFNHSKYLASDNMIEF